MFKLEEGWLTVGLLATMITVAAGGVAAAAWADGLQAAWITGVLGVLAGLALAKSRFGGGTAFMFATVYGLFVVGYFVGLTLLQGDWNSRAIEIVVRLNAFIYKVLHGGTNRDGLPFPVTIALLFWYIGLLMAWSVFRRSAVWPAIIPAGVGLLVNAYYYLGPARIDLYLAFYVLLALMFVARMTLLGREREWQTARVSYSTDLRLDFLRAGLAAALAAVLIGWAAPGLAASPTAATTWREMTGSFRVVRESWMRMFASIRGYGQAYSDFYGDSLVLGGPARLSADPIMDVHINAISGEDLPVQDVADNIQRYYWRAAAYGDYDDGGWQVGETTFREFDPGDGSSRVQAAPYAERRQVSLAFTMHVAASSRLYVAPQPVWFDRAGTLEITFDPNADEHNDITAVRSQQVLRRGEVYQMISAISIADEASLQKASTDYPAWVREGFLAVPPEVTQRTRDLARQIVTEAGATTPYDQAVAITTWLRENISYDQGIDAPPPNIDPIDYVLFVSRRGYCNYYASAEVLMLRSLGIPARLAVGFSQGTLDDTGQTFHVLEQNAHAWPEVFFPTYGWVEFEPTTSEDPLIRPVRSASEDSGGSGDPNADDLAESLRDRLDGLIPPEELANPVAPTASNQLIAWLQSLPWPAIGLSVLSLALAGLLLGVFSMRAGVVGWESFGRLGTWFMARGGQLLPSAVALVYMQFERALHWLGLPSTSATTPDERASAFTQALPETGPGVATLTREYVTEQYSPRPANPAAAQRAWSVIRLPVLRDTLRAYLLELFEEEAP